MERAFASGKPAYWLRDNSALLKLTKVYENLGFSVVKIYDNGGMVLVHRSAETKKGDYKDLMEIAHAFASQGSFVQIPPRIHRDEKIYNEIYRTRGTKYYGKCPDLIIDGKNYEYESFQRPWNKRKLSHQLSNGLKQSDRIIIDTRDSGLKHPFIRKAIFNRIKGDPDTTGKIIPNLWASPPWLDRGTRLCTPDGKALRLEILDWDGRKYRHLDKNKI